MESVASCDVQTYDRVAPPAYQSARLLPGARGVIVAASGGPALFDAFRSRMRQEPTLWAASDPYDAFVATLLARADAALAAAEIASRRFDAAVGAPVAMDFLALARLVGLGSPSPFRLYVSETYGPWWALRAAWLVAADVAPARPLRLICQGCPAPCVGGREHADADTSAETVAAATPEVRARCVVGQEHRYSDDQIAYHYERARTRLRMGEEDGFRGPAR